MLGRGAFSLFCQRGSGAGGGGAAGLATSASVLTRTSAVTAYPPTISFTRPIDWQDGDKAVMQWSTDSTFATGVTETATPQTLTAAVTTYNFGLSAIVSGVYYMRLGAWRGTRPGSLNWSNTTGVGNATVPTISSASTMADYQFVSGTLALVASMTSTWAIVGGSGMAQFTVSGSTLSSVAPPVAGTLIVQVQATSLFGVASAVQQITDTVAANTPNAFPFTAVTNATLSTPYTSNTITIAGIAGGALMPVSITGGTYSKNGGAFTAVTTGVTAVNGDTFAVQETSSPGNNASVTTRLTIGATFADYAVSTPVVLSTTTTWNPADKDATITLSNVNMTSNKPGAASFRGVRSTTSKSSGKRYIEFTIGGTGGGGDNVGCGLGNATASLAAVFGDANSMCAYSAGSFVGGGATGFGSYVAGDVINIAIDLGAQRSYWRKNGAAWADSGDPVAGTGGQVTTGLGTTIFILGGHDWSTPTNTLNTGHSAWTYAPPTGYSAWDV